MISCEFGHFWVDLRRGQVFKVDSNGRNLTEVTPGLRNWFKEHLQMKIIRSRIYNADTDAELSYYDIDNKFFGIGLSMGWDNRFKRVLITKKDYMPVGNPSSTNSVAVGSTGTDRRWSCRTPAISRTSRSPLDITA